MEENGAPENIEPPLAQTTEEIVEQNADVNPSDSAEKNDPITLETSENIEQVENQTVVADSVEEPTGPLESEANTSVVNEDALSSKPSTETQEDYIDTIQPKEATQSEAMPLASETSQTAVDPAPEAVEIPKPVEIPMTSLAVEAVEALDKTSEIISAKSASTARKSAKKGSISSRQASEMLDDAKADEIDEQQAFRKRKDDEKPVLAVDFFYEYDTLKSKPVISEDSNLSENVLTL